MLAFIGAVIPTVGVSFLFWLGIRAMLQADRRERAAMAAADTAERLRSEPSE
jgi:threonine/homoserine/homoserine lactone efflux protein